MTRQFRYWIRKLANPNRIHVICGLINSMQNCSSLLNNSKHAYARHIATAQTRSVLKMAFMLTTSDNPANKDCLNLPYSKNDPKIAIVHLVFIYWSRVNMPVIQIIKMPPSLQRDPLLWMKDRAAVLQDSMVHLYQRPKLKFPADPTHSSLGRRSLPYGEHAHIQTANFVSSLFWQS